MAGVFFTNISSIPNGSLSLRIAPPKKGPDDVRYEVMSFDVLQTRINRWFARFFITHGQAREFCVMKNKALRVAVRETLC